MCVNISGRFHLPHAQHSHGGLRRRAHIPSRKGGFHVGMSTINKTTNKTCHCFGLVLLTKKASMNTKILCRGSILRGDLMNTTCDKMQSTSQSIDEQHWPTGLKIDRKIIPIQQTQHDGSARWGQHDAEPYAESHAASKQPYTLGRGLHERDETDHSNGTACFNDWKTTGRTVQWQRICICNSWKIQSQTTYCSKRTCWKMIRRRKYT
jgi:hypothetical protein